MLSRLVILLSISMWLLSCSSSGDHEKSVPVSDSVAPSRKPAVLSRIKTPDTVLSFAGVWVNEIYVDKIRKSHSPRLSQGIMASCIVIPDSTLKETNMVAGFHEGGPQMVVVKIGERYQFYDPPLKTPLDTIEPLGPRRLRIGNQYFARLSYPDPRKTDWGILEELLFSGKYQKVDGGEVVFGTDGHITGLDSILYYEPVIDFADRGDGQVDRINLGQSHKKLDDYSFRFDGDTLLIYTVDCLQYNANEKGCDSATFGYLLWKLKKEVR